MAGTDERDEAVSRFVERFSAVLTEAGFPRMAARVFVALLATDTGRSTAPELMDYLQSSAGAVSGAVRYLAQVDLIDREHEPGSRKDHYRVRDDVWHEAFVRRDKMLARWEAGLRDGVVAVGENTPAGRRLGESVDFFAFLQMELPALLDRWRDYRSDPPPARGGDTAP